jgi:transcriptional regulator with XRE-family HTH domain
MTAPIAALGEALYGPRWQASLARDLGLHPQTVTDWARGINAPRAATRARLIAHARKFMRRAGVDAEAIRAALEEFEASAPPPEGRPAKLDGDALEEAQRLWGDLTITGAEAARRIGLDRANLYRTLGPRGR